MKRLYTFLALLMLIPWTSTQASHISGGEILYECTGNPNEFIITLNLFRDCDGIPLSSSQDIDINSPCGGTQNVTMNLQNPGGTEISQLCPPEIPNSQCSGGTLPGMELYTFTATVTLNPVCDFYTFSWSTCCRNTTINVPSSTGDDTYIEATVNTEDFPCNDSPVFNAQPIPYVCVNQLINYSFGVSDAEGDSLVYSLIPGMEFGGNNLVYGGVFSGTNPIDGITIDSQTGLINFTANLIGNYIVVVQVEQFDPVSGELIGTVMRDIQVVVVNCANNPPDPTSGTIGSFTGSALNPGNYDIEMCPTDSFCMTVQIDDPNAGDSLSLFTNLQTVLPGATLNTSHGPGGNPLFVDICWTAPANMNGLFSFILVAEDDACPIASQQTYVYTVNIPTSTTAGPDQIICGDQSAQLGASGGSDFNWSVISGDPITPGNFSCNPCADPVASPSTTTVYEVVSNLGSTCQNRDTVEVTVVPDFDFTITQPNPNPCLDESVSLELDITPSGTYSYDWDLIGTPTQQSTIDIDSDSIEDPTLSNASIGGTYTYVVTIATPEGCIQSDTFDVNIVQAFAPVVTALADSGLCAGDTLQLSASLQLTNPNVVYTWSPDSLLNDPNISDPLTNPLLPTQYVVQALDTSTGCTSYDTLDVAIYPQPNVSFNASPDIGVAPLPVDFINTSDASAMDFVWTIDDLGTSQDVNPSWLFETPGTYSVWLAARNEWWCFAGAYGVVIVEQPFSIAIPNVFSPNGDQYNEVFEIFNEGIVEWDLVILDRWGKEAYRTTDPTAHWDGKDASEGTYFYMLKVVSTANEAFEYTGHVTLVR